MTLLLALTACDDEPAAEDSPAETADTADTADSEVDDEDGDGHSALEAGGDDCDDADATTFPGATELCDPVDHDCDGEALAEGVCAGTQDLSLLERRVATTRSGGNVTFTGDVTGDGTADLLFAYESLVDESGVSLGYATGGVALYAGGAPGLPTVHPDGIARGWTEDGGIYSTSNSLLDVGDVDGDGNRDVGIVGVDLEDGIYLHLGPFEPDGSTEPIRNADAAWWSPDNEDTWGNYAAGGADFDGDGRDDAVVQLYTIGAEEPVAFDAFFGGDLEEGHYVRVYGYGFAGDVQILDDLDGDGIQDLLVGDGLYHWVSGASIRESDGAEIAEIALATMRAPYAEDPDRGRFDDAWLSVGDLDGDGVPEVAAGSRTSREAGADYFRGEIGFFSGALRGEFGLADVAGSYVGDEERQWLGSYLVSADLDGDGQAEFVAGAGPEDWHVIRGGQGLPAPFTPIPEQAWRIDWTYATSPVAQDFTGDGLPDLAVAHDYAIGIIPGWEIPWDEPQWW